MRISPVANGSASNMFIADPAPTRNSGRQTWMRLFIYIETMPLRLVAIRVGYGTTTFAERRNKFHNRHWLRLTLLQQVWRYPT